MREDRKDKRGGGMAIAVRSSLKYIAVKPDIRYIGAMEAIKLFGKNDTIVIVSYYRPLDGCLVDGCLLLGHGLISYFSIKEI